MHLYVEFVMKLRFSGGRRDHDHMVVGFITTYVSSADDH